MDYIHRFIMKYLFALLMSVVFLANFAVQAQPVYQWNPDKKIPGYLKGTFTPFLLADQNRTVHAFANQWAGYGSGRRQAIFYRQWTLSGGWTRPIAHGTSPARQTTRETIPVAKACRPVSGASG